MRRPPRIARDGRRTSRRWGLVALLAVAAVGLSAAGAAAGALDRSATPRAASASTATATPGPSAANPSRTPSLQVYAAQGGVVAPGAELTLTVVINNPSATAVPAGTVSVGITEKPLADRDELTGWLNGGDAAARTLQSAPTAPLPGGSSGIVATVIVPAANLGLTAGQTSVFGLSAALDAAGETVTAGRSSLVWNPAPPTQRTKLAVAMPLTVPATTSGLVSANDLSAYTSPDGLLSRQLDAAREAPTIALGIDPMIIASINVLGSSAPASARDWLQQLAALPNETFALQYGDADAAGQLQAGIAAPLAPLSFGYALDPTNFTSKLSVGETATPTPTPAAPTPTPSATPTGNPNLPTTEQLVSWPYSLHGVVWPLENSMTNQAATQLAKAGYTTSILSSDNTTAESLKTTPGSALPVQGGTALVADSGVSTELRDAFTATGDDDRGAAIARLNATLALIDAEPAPSGRVVLATLGRSWPASWQRAAQTLTALGTMPWITSASLAEAIASSPTEGLAIKDKSEDSDRVALIRQLQGNGDHAADGTLRTPTGEAGLQQFATMLDDPTQLTGPTRNGMLSLLGVGWLRPENDWPAAVATTLKKMQRTLSSVQIEPTGNITVASAQSQIPITVTNGFGLPVNVMLSVNPSNGRIEVEQTTEKTIPAGASGKVLVPVKAKLGNGKVTLRMQLFTPPDATGTQYRIGQGQSAAVDVHAEWEGIGALIIGLLGVLIFGFGLVRAIVRRRRERDGHGEDAAVQPSGDAAGSSGDAGGAHG